MAATEVMTGKLGHRQRQMLHDMIRYGNGQFPSSWTLTYAKKEMLATLEQRGLIRSTGTGWDITNRGREAITKRE